MWHGRFPFPLTPPWWGNIIRCPINHLDADDDVLSHDRRDFVIQTGDTRKGGR